MARLGQNFLADTNLLDAIVREAEVGPADVVLEVGPGEGALTERLAGRARHLHAIEIDRRLAGELAPLAAREGVDVIWADAMKVDLSALRPAPTVMVANLPYSVATPVLLRTISELPGMRRWTVMVQLEIADRLRAAPGSKQYGSPSVVVQLACRARLLRRVDRAVFKPRPRVDSAVLGLERIGPAPSTAEHRLIRQAFAHRRKALARSVELTRPGSLAPVREALVAMGLPADARAEQLTPDQFRALSAAIDA